MLAVEQDAQPPDGEASVEIGTLGRGQPLPEGRAVDVDQLVGQDTLLDVERLAPVDVAGDIPLVALGVLVEAAQVGGVDRIGVLEDGLVLGGDGVALDHGRVPFEYRY